MAEDKGSNSNSGNNSYTRQEGSNYHKTGCRHGQISSWYDKYMKKKGK